MLNALEDNTNIISTKDALIEMKCVSDQLLAEENLKRITKRTSGKEQNNALKIVEEIIDQVEKKGDEAVASLTLKFDGFDPKPLYVNQEKLSKAWESTPSNLKKSLEIAQKRITAFHKEQIPKDIEIKGKYGERMGRRWLPVKKAGIYIPGGRAAYPSTVLMNAIPALVAGVNEIYMFTPADSNGEVNQTVLAAAYLVGIKKVFRIGGAQAVAAMACGTQTIPKVDVISGPGNLYVTLAKKTVYGKVGIDSLAGPSEVLIIADESASKNQVACDLLAQAEHDPLAAAILITTSKNLAKEINKEISRQLINHPRAEICRQSINNWGLIINCEELDSCIKLSDDFAPEHLEILTKNPELLAQRVSNAGAIFLGSWTPEAVGDYLAGPNHTLPTSGTARFSGALGVETFMKNTSIIQFNEKALNQTGKSIIELANSEGLHSHSESIKVRISKSSEDI